MQLALRITLVALCVTNGLCCLGGPFDGNGYDGGDESGGEGGDGGDGGPYETLAPATDAPFETAATRQPLATPASNLDEFLGPDVSSEEWDKGRYIAEGGGPVNLNGLLDCDFEGECCYVNAEPPEDQLQWVLIKGETDPVRIKDSFGADVAPSGKFLMAASEKAEDPFAEARFVSCSITCTDLEVKVRLKHWTTDDVILQVCTRDSFFTDETPLLNCQDVVQSSSAGPTEVVLPPGEVFDVVIVARQFLYDSGGAAIIDDLEVDYKLCGPSTTTAEPTEATTTAETTEATTEDGGGESTTEDGESTTEDGESTTEDGESTTAEGEGDEPAECQAVVCSFEEKDACSYTDVSDKSGGFLGFQVVSGRFKNALTGILNAAEGQYYLASFLRPGQKSALLAKAADLTEDRVIRFQAYEATHGLEFRGCCGDGEDRASCPFLSVMEVEVSDRQWQSVSFKCPKGTKHIAFICENTGKHLGACGVDNIEMLVDEGGDAEDASTSACADKRR